jgi:phosphate transport system substrate-binding protein
LKGEWKDKPIRLHGSVINAFFMRTVERRVFGGEGVTWNPDFQQYETCILADGKRWYRQDQVSDAVGDDKFAMGLAYRQFGDRTDLKVLKIAADENSRYLPLTLENLYDRSYPLSGPHPMYINRKPGTPVDPALKEYLRYILSREGQEAVARHGKYLPLSPELAKAELKKLD